MFVCLFVIASASSALAQATSGSRKGVGVDPVPRDILLRIVEAEDKRRWDNDLNGLLADRNPSVRTRAALAAGRIGDERAVPILVSLLQNDKDTDVRAMAAFALGETETPAAGDALAAALATQNESKLRARVVEALGKTTASLPQTEGTRLQAWRKAILGVLESEASGDAGRDAQVVLLALTAALRARPEGAGKVIAQFLTLSDPRIRADAANALARLRAKDGNEQLRKLLTADPDPIVRANAARVLGATEDKAALDALIDRALKDTDSRVRVSAIRALAALNDTRAVQHLITRAGSPFTASVPPALLDGINRSDLHATEVLEIATSLGRILSGTEHVEALAWLKEIRADFSSSAPEVEVAMVRISPQGYLLALGTGAAARRRAQEALMLDWRAASSLAQGLGAIATLADSMKDRGVFAEQAQDILLAMLDYKNSGININTLVAVHSEYAVPDVLRAFAAFKPRALRDVLLSHLKETDVIIRATAAELLGELPPDQANTLELTKALSVALADKVLNDAALAILDSLPKQKSDAANDAIKSALDSSDHLIRRRAVALLKANGAGDFSARIGTVQTENTKADYERATLRIGKRVTATILTSKGSFTIQLLPNEAPLTVDSFIRLSRRGYFKGITFHRVVPNFVIQGGDPRGDGNGGPGYQIRCEINQVPYERGMVGMALSGKDTGGSQWFVTHSAQPHLEGGYTVFGRVISGMDVVDRIFRGDIIRSTAITEARGRSKSR
jgi:cyclophilin family peptidyl-prolyl cis-trans isomerase/HEAT repeat protein